MSNSYQIQYYRAAISFLTETIRIVTNLISKMKVNLQIFGTFQSLKQGLSHIQSTASYRVKSSSNIVRKICSKICCSRSIELLTFLLRRRRRFSKPNSVIIINSKALSIRALLLYFPFNFN